MRATTSSTTAACSLGSSSRCGANNRSWNRLLTVGCQRAAGWKPAATLLRNLHSQPHSSRRTCNNQVMVIVPASRPPTFVQGIGLPLEEAIRFWRTEMAPVG